MAGAATGVVTVVVIEGIGAVMIWDGAATLANNWNNPVHYAKSSGSGGSSYGDWYEGTFSSPEASAQYHYGRHGGPWSDIDDYTNAAKQFYDNNKNLARPHALRTGETGVKISTQDYYGIYTQDGRIVSFGRR